MLVRVKLIGSGKPGDPYRAPLPTYTTVLTLIEEGVIYATVPDDGHPALHEHKSAKLKPTSHGDLLHELDADGHAKWHKHLDEKYKEHDGEFRPEIA